MTLRAVVLLCASTNFACGSSQSCTLNYEYYSIEVARDLPIDFSDVSTLRFEACEGSGAASSCQTAYAKDGKLGTELTLQGTVSQLPDGKAHVDAHFWVGEKPPSSITPVSFRVRDNATGTVLLEATGEVHWDDDSCHTHPLNTSF